MRMDNVTFNFNQWIVGWSFGVGFCLVLNGNPVLALICFGLGFLTAAN